jgi:hypothetical protein
MVRRPGGALEHQFSTARDAEAFVGRECAGSPVLVEIIVGGIYIITAQIDPYGPTLFCNHPQKRYRWRPTVFRGHPPS